MLMRAHQVFILLGFIEKRDVSDLFPLVSSVQFSKSGKYILTGGKDSTVRLWDVRTGQQVSLFGGSFDKKSLFFF